MMATNSRDAMTFLSSSPRKVAPSVWLLMALPGLMKGNHRILYALPGLVRGKGHEHLRPPPGYQEKHARSSRLLRIHEETPAFPGRSILARGPHDIGESSHLWGDLRH